MQGMLQPAIYICVAQAFKATTGHHCSSAVASKEGTQAPLLPGTLPFSWCGRLEYYCPVKDHLGLKVKMP